MEPQAASTTVSMLDISLIRRFATALKGQLILPGNESYESARRVWNWAFDLRPGMIVRCANREDVTRAVDFACSNDLLVAVRSGGHSFAGHSSCEGGVVIDLSAMKGIRVDREKQIAHAEGGLTVGEFDKETQSLGLTTPMGACAATGLAGLTLGGGLGWLTARYGASCDNLLAAEVITADGNVLAATPQENTDLFWGIRGGGGNFGIATSLSYRLYPVSQVWGGARAYPLSQAGETLRFFRQFTAAAPDELSSLAGIVPLASGPAFGIFVCCSADLATGERLLKPLRTFGRPLADSIRPMPYLEVQAGQSDVPAMEQLSFHQKSGFLCELTDETIDIIVSQLAEAPTALCGSSLWHHHGAVCRVGTSENAFSFREPGYYFWTQSFWQDRPAADSSIEWVNRSWNGLRAFFSSALYVNQLLDEGEERVRAAYGGNYDRLVTLKNRYDPTNFFRMNQNIRPTN
jgi:FAD binding domain-containing protein/berberine-like enzyme